MKNYIYNKVTKKIIELDENLNSLEAFNKACEIFDIPKVKMTTRINMEEYIKNKDTKKIIITFGMEDWEIYTTIT